VNKRNVVKNSVASIESDDASLGIPKKQSRIPAMVMWYLPVSDRLRHFFSNLKDAELMQWWDSDKCKKGDGRLRHPADCGRTNLNYTGSSTRVHSRGLQRASNGIIPWPVG
jgi:hypothetical protein